VSTKSEIGAFLDTYRSAWHHRDPEEIASFYSFPALLVTSAGVVRLTDGAGAIPHFRRIVEANWDDLAHPWSRKDLEVTVVGDHAALASLRWVGTGPDGRELGEHAHTYLIDTTRGESILVDVVHAPTAI
jgi:ketosteroid isomerase-like protein